VSDRSTTSYLSRVLARLPFILIVILLGCATTVGVSWYYSTRANIIYANSRIDNLIETADGGEIEVSLSKRMGVEWLSIMQTDAAQSKMYRDMLAPDIDDNINTKHPYETIAPEWSIWANHEDIANTQIKQLLLNGEVASGWPWLACSYEWVIVPREGTKCTNGIPHSYGPMKMYFGPPRAFPVRILARGFTLDALFYSGLWAVLITLFRRLKRFTISSRRARRGLCIQCGYNLKGSVEEGCPECGWMRSDGDTEG